MPVRRVQRSDEGVVDECDSQGQGEDLQGGLGCSVIVTEEDRRERPGQNEDADADRPAHQQERFVETVQSVEHVGRALAVIDGKHREHDREERDGHEEKRFDRLVRRPVVGSGELAVERVDQGLIDPEIDDREDEGEGKREAFPEPFA